MKGVINFEVENKHLATIICGFDMINHEIMRCSFLLPAVRCYVSLSVSPALLSPKPSTFMCFMPGVFFAALSMWEHGCHCVIWDKVLPGDPRLFAFRWNLYIDISTGSWGRNIHHRKWLQWKRNTISIPNNITSHIPKQSQRHNSVWNHSWKFSFLQGCVYLYHFIHQNKSLHLCVYK